MLAFNVLAPSLQALSLRGNWYSGDSLPLFALPNDAHRTTPSESAEAVNDTRRSDEFGALSGCACASCTRPFGSLEKLDVSNNSLDFPELLAAVAKLPSLTALHAAEVQLGIFPLPGIPPQQNMPSGQAQVSGFEGSESQLCSLNLKAYLEGLTGANTASLQRITELSVEQNPVVDQWVQIERLKGFYAVTIRLGTRVTRAWGGVCVGTAGLPLQLHSQTCRNCTRLPNPRDSQQNWRTAKPRRRCPRILHQMLRLLFSPPRCSER